MLFYTDVMREAVILKEILISMIIKDGLIRFLIIIEILNSQTGNLDLFSLFFTFP